MQRVNGQFYIFFLFFLLFVLSPTEEPPHFISPDESDRLNQYLQHEVRELGDLKNRTRQDGPTFLTGVSSYPNSTSQYGMLPSVLEDQFSQTMNAKGLSFSYFTMNDIQGELKYGGILPSINMSYPQPPQRTIANRTMIKDNAGVRCSFKALPPRPGTANTNITILEADVELITGGGKYETLSRLTGFFLQNTSSFVLSSSSLKFSGFRALPFVIDHRYFNESRQLLFEYEESKLRPVSSKWERQDTEPLYNRFELSLAHANRCEFIMFGNLSSIGLNQRELDNIQDELNEPLGRPHADVGKVKVTSYIFSPDCSVYYTPNEDLEGHVLSDLYHRDIMFLMCLTVLMILQACVVCQQMHSTNTSVTIAKVSALSVSLMALADAFMTCLSFFATLSAPTTIFLSAFCFIGFALTIGFYLRYICHILYQQSADTMETSINIGQLRYMVYSRFFASLLLLGILLVQSAAWPPSIQNAIRSSCLIMLSSLWIPQISRDAYFGMRKSVTVPFLITASLVRSLYLLLLESRLSPISLDLPTKNWILISILWIWIQSFVIIIQGYFGARFFVPWNLLPVLYDYHPLFYIEDVESGQTISIVPTNPQQPDENTVQLSKLQYLARTDGQAHCAICMNPVKVVMLTKHELSSAKSPSTILSRQSYMVTPCCHVFHADCMEQWMKAKLQCPVCRSSLTPI